MAEALLEADLIDIEIGGVDLAPSAREAILENATDEGKWIEKRLKTTISKSSGWGREELARFLADGQKRRGRAIEVAAKRKRGKSP